MVTSDGDVISTKHGKTKTLKDQDNGKGYRSVGLTHKGKTVRFLVHRLVANAFIPNSEGKETVNHINEIKYDNTVDNLEWMTQKENVRYSCGRIVEGIIYQLNKLDEIIAVWSSVDDADKCGFSSSSVSSCCKDQSKTYRDFRWTNRFDEDKLVNAHFIDMRGVM